MTPMMVVPADSKASITRSSAAFHTAGLRMTPFPLLASRGPASNWGFTSTTRSPPGRTSSTSTGATTVSEMNERSPTTTSL